MGKLERKFIWVNDILTGRTGKHIILQKNNIQPCNKHYDVIWLLGQCIYSHNDTEIGVPRADLY